MKPPGVRVPGQEKKNKVKKGAAKKGKKGKQGLSDSDNDGFG